VSMPDLTLAGTARDLEVAAVDWPAVMRRGYFGTGERWERRGRCRDSPAGADAPAETHPEQSFAPL
jgi:hypothetical protein